MSGQADTPMLSDQPDHEDLTPSSESKAEIKELVSIQSTTLEHRGVGPSLLYKPID
jgi:hypothetical protein